LRRLFPRDGPSFGRPGRVSAFRARDFRPAVLAVKAALRKTAGVWRTLRQQLARLLASSALVGIVAIAPGTVVCVGPGSHCHLENPIGGSCNSSEPSERSSSRAPDGCPRGSRDFQLSVAAHHDVGIAAFISSPPPAPARAAALSAAPRAAPHYIGAAGLAAPPNSTVVLRC